MLQVNSTDSVKAGNLTLREPLFVLPSTGLLEMLNIFQSGQCHLAIVTSNPAESLRCLRSGVRPPSSVSVQGIITLEDIIEKIIQDDIVDETDACSPRYRPDTNEVFYRKQRSQVVPPPAASASSTPRTTSSTPRATTVLYRKLMHVGTHRASCPDLFGHPVLSSGTEGGGGSLRQRQGSVGEETGAFDVGLSFEDNGDLPASQQDYMRTSYQQPEAFSEKRSVDSNMAVRSKPGEASVHVQMTLLDATQRAPQLPSVREHVRCTVSTGTENKSDTPAGLLSNIDSGSAASLLDRLEMEPSCSPSPSDQHANGSCSVDER